jgi:CubicO group peptidase (beta-lactamase class C family)
MNTYLKTPGTNVHGSNVLNILYWFVLLTFASATTSAQTNNELKASMEALVREAAEKDIFSGNVLVARDGNVILDQSVGLADIERNIPNLPETSFAIGSITKFFTKLLILQLVQEGKISLEDPLEKYFTGFDTQIGKKVRIKHLINHQSGFGQYFDIPGFEKEETKIEHSEQVLNFIRLEQLLFEPGTEVEYSNSGYFLLGLILEKVTGTDYRTALKNRISDKLGLAHTGYDLVNKAADGKATGYLTNMPGPKKNNLLLHLIGGGDGGIYMTTSDLWDCIKSLLSDNLLLDETSKLSLFTLPGSPVTYTSWNDFLQKGRLMVAGGDPGLNAVLGINQEKKYCLIVFSNYDQGSAEAVAVRLSAILQGNTPDPFDQGAGQDIKIVVQQLCQLARDTDAAGFKNQYLQIYTSAGIPPDDDMILLHTGNSLIEEQDYDNALKVYLTYTQDFPNIVVAWNDLGDIYVAKNDKVNAKKCYEQALKLRPGNERAKKAILKL